MGIDPCSGLNKAFASSKSTEGKCSKTDKSECSLTTAEACPCGEEASLRNPTGCWLTSLAGAEPDSTVTKEMAAGALSEPALFEVVHELLAGYEVVGIENGTSHAYESGGAGRRGFR